MQQWQFIVHCPVALQYFPWPQSETKWVFHRHWMESLSDNKIFSHHNSSDLTLKNLSRSGCLFIFLDFTFTSSSHDPPQSWQRLEILGWATDGPSLQGWDVEHEIHPAGILKYFWGDAEPLASLQQSTTVQFMSAATLCYSLNEQKNEPSLGSVITGQCGHFVFS